jgi:hypothetical protein
VPLLGPQIKIAEIGFPQTDGTPHQMVWGRLLKKSSKFERSLT